MNIDQISLEYANKMYHQLGGETFKLMTGAFIFPLVNIEVEENIKSRVSLFISLLSYTSYNFIFNKIKISDVFMHLMNNDMYTFQFTKKGVDRPFKTVCNVSCEKVQNVFEFYTGLSITPYNNNNSQTIVGINV